MNRFAKITVPADISFLETVGCFVTRVAKLAGMKEEDISRIELAVDEACTNVISHGYDHDASQQFSVNCSYDEAFFFIQIEDYGKPFDFEAVPQPNLDAPIEERKIGGLGIFFIRQVMDEVTYSQDPDGKKRLSMKKKI